MPDCAASARKSRLASGVRRILLACFFSMTQLYTILRHKTTLLLLRSKRPFLSAVNDGAPRLQNLVGLSPSSRLLYPLRVHPA